MHLNREHGFMKHISLCDNVVFLCPWGCAVLDSVLSAVIPVEIGICFVVVYFGVDFGGGDASF